MQCRGWFKNGNLGSMDGVEPGRVCISERWVVKREFAQSAMRRGGGNQMRYQLSTHFLMYECSVPSYPRIFLA